MSLHLVPIEILLQVIGYIYALADRASLSQSCRCFHEIIRPLLYSEFVASNARAALLFIRTISQTPAIALHVKRLELAISTPDLDSRAPFECNPTLLHEDWSALKRQLKGYATSRDELASGGTVSWAEPFIDAAASNFFRNLTYQITDYISACLLLLLPNLENTHARYSGGNGSSCLEVLRMARTLQVRDKTRANDSKTSTFSLPNLRESSGMSGTFQLQSIRKFSCNIPYHVQADLKSCLYEIQVKDLALRSFSTSTLNVGLILRQCHHLESLRISFSHPKYQGVVSRGMMFESSVFFESIAHLTNTLESLSIDLNAGEPSPIGWLFPSSPFPVTKLYGFHRLHRLEISRNVLFGKSTYSNSELDFRCEDLPVSLKHLVIYEPVPRIILQHNLGALDPGSLKAIVWPTEQEQASAERSYEEILSAKFQKHGITVSYASQ